MNWLIKLTRILAVLLLMLFTWAILIFHYADLKPTQNFSTSDLRVSDYGTWVDKNYMGINQMILKGPPFERSWAAGQLTKSFMHAEEDDLIAKFRKVIPSRFLQYVFQVVGIRWFWGIDSYFRPEHLDEMYGTSFAASEKHNDLLQPYTRQVAFHGLHEVGQMMVDQQSADFGCTLLAYPLAGKWIIGRNFDFEGGRIFDEEKIMKWVFPNEGYAFLSITWAGMVGAVTGINEHGVYISMNAAGSNEYVRFGTPTTLVLLHALQSSKNAAEAVEIIRNAQFFITDIFMVSDREGTLIKIEKSPKNVEVLKITEPIAVANHLTSERWKSDSVNLYRSSELTSHYREKSGYRILSKIKSPKISCTVDEA